MVINASLKLTACQDALGMESCEISDDQITASLYTNLDHAPYRARLYNQERAGAWTTPAGSHWLQIDFGLIPCVLLVWPQRDDTLMTSG